MTIGEYGPWYGPWAVIAGGSEGGGAAFAHRLADAGLNQDGPVRVAGGSYEAAQKRAGFPRDRKVLTAHEATRAMLPDPS